MKRKGWLLSLIFILIIDGGIFSCKETFGGFFLFILCHQTLVSFKRILCLLNQLFKNKKEMQTVHLVLSLSHERS